MKKQNINFKSEKGSAAGFVVVILLCITLLAGATITLAQTQMNMSRFSRQTSNSYHLARSGAEKVVDSMNKSIAKEMPRLVETANRSTHLSMINGSGSSDGVKYIDGDNEYSGKYIGSSYDKEYEKNLKLAIYDYIKTEFVDNNQLEYEATKTDVKKPIPIEIKTKVYNKDNLPVDIKNEIGGLSARDAIGTGDKDAFAVQVVALAKEGSKTSLAKSTVVGVVAIDDFLEEEELLEEYKWAIDEHGVGVYPEALQSAVITFGDFVINGNNQAVIRGDVHVKGTKRHITGSEYAQGNFPDTDESGGIIVSNGAKLKVDGNAFVLKNIQTTNSVANKDKSTKIEIANDAIANTIGIHDNYYENHPTNLSPWENYIENNEILIGRNAFIDNDIKIEKYVKDSNIDINNSVFGVSDGDSAGMNISDITFVDPNKSSGLYSLGEDSKINMGRAFIAGQAFINFGDGNGYHRLYESAGEPFEDVYYLEEYRNQYGSNKEYLDDFKELINKDKIVIRDRTGAKPHGYAPAFVSESGDTHDISDTVINQAQARDIFYKGFPSGFSSFGDLTSSSDWNEFIKGTTTPWKNILLDPREYYKGKNSFNKDYGLSDAQYSAMQGYKGIQGYMLAKRGVFYEGFIHDTNSTSIYEPKERTFSDLIDLTPFTNNYKWSYNNPILVINGDTAINIDIYEGVPTAIVSRDASSVIRLQSAANKKFEGIIVTPGKIIIENPMKIEGVIISGNEKMDSTIAKREDIADGVYAGLEIKSNNVEIIHNMDKILEIRCLDKSVQRRLFDSLKITDYKSASSLSNQQKIDKIMGERGTTNRRVNLREDSVISTDKGGLKLVIKSLRKL